MGKGKGEGEVKQHLEQIDIRPGTLPRKPRSQVYIHLSPSNRCPVLLLRLLLQQTQQLLLYRLLPQLLLLLLVLPVLVLLLLLIATKLWECIMC